MGGSGKLYVQESMHRLSTRAILGRWGIDGKCAVDTAFQLMSTGYRVSLNGSFLDKESRSAQLM